MRPISPNRSKRRKPTATVAGCGSSRSRTGGCCRRRATTTRTPSWTPATTSCGESRWAFPCAQPADGNGDLVVDNRDYGVWRQHFGETVPLPGSFSITTPLVDTDGTFTISWSASAAHNKFINS